MQLISRMPPKFSMHQNTAIWPEKQSSSLSEMLPPSPSPTIPSIRLVLGSQASQAPLAPEPVAKKPRGRPKKASSSSESSEALKSRRPHWDKDGIDGGPSSIDILIEWLKIPENIDRYRNGWGGERPGDVLNDVSEYLAANGAPTARDPDECARKIHELHTQWREINDWRHGTGNGKGGWHMIMAERDGDRDKIELVRGRLDRQVLKKLPWFHELASIFQEQDGGSASQRSDTTMDLNPALETLNGAMMSYRGSEPLPSQSTSAPWTSDTSDIEDDPSTDASSSIQQTQLPPSTPVAVSGPSTPSWTSSMPQIPSSADRSISEKALRRKGPKGLKTDFGTSYFQQEQEYRARKQAHLDQMLALQAATSKAELGKAVFESAEILKRLDPSRSWESCKAEARRELGLDG